MQKKIPIHQVLPIVLTWICGKKKPHNTFFFFFCIKVLQLAKFND